MYQIYANNELIYDSTLEDLKISKGLVTLETNKSGSFVFGIYPNHFYYDRFVRLKTIITVYKSGKIKFRGRILSDVTDFWNNKVITCEGELGFLQDAIIRPFEFVGTPEELFIKFMTEYNSQVDDDKKFNIGTVTVVDPNNYIARSNSKYETAYSNMTSRLIDDSLGGYFHITHGEDGTDPTPTIHYLADFTDVSSQKIEFGANLKDYTKTVKAESIATAIIPLGYTIDDGNSETEDKRLTIESVNGGIDYVFDANAVAMYGWIFKVVEWDDVTTAEALKTKAEAYLQESINQNITIELNAIDLHLLDRDIESYSVCQYIPVSSEPHNFEATLLCNKQTLNLLKPDNDRVTLGYTYSTFTEYASKSNNKSNNSLAVIKLDINNTITATKNELNNNISNTKTELLNEITNQDLAVQRLTSLMVQSLGVFKSEEVLENGSIVYYMHDNQLLSESKTIWKMTADAFAVSTDGGKTWTAGLDSNGNAVLNMLSVIGLTAEWIKAGILQSINGSSYWNLETGDIHLDGEFVQSTDDGHPAVEIKNHQVMLYDWASTFELIGGILSLFYKSSDRREVSLWCTDDNRASLSVKDSNSGEYYPVITVDGKSYKTDPPWIKNTATGTLFEYYPGGGITVKNGLITNWDMATIVGDIEIPNINGSGKTLTIHVQNGLIADWDYT